MEHHRFGFERPRPVALKGERGVHILPHHDFLSEYVELKGGWHQDTDTDQTAWPEMIDQRGLGRFCRGWEFEDAEEDDAPGGNIDDEPHDAREEDGI